MVTRDFDLEYVTLGEFNNLSMPFDDYINFLITTLEKEMTDYVNSPPHYNSGNIECIDAIEESMTPDAFKGYLKGNIQKYMAL